jgi:hypothetical protein
MSPNKSAAPPQYTIWFDGKTRTGTASELLEEIRRSATRSAVIQRLDVDEYAARIIADADYYLPSEVLDFLRKERFDSQHARALRYLSEMDSSGVRILSER